MHRVAEPVADLAAEIQPNPGRVLVQPSVCAGESALKDPRQIFLCNADAGVRYRKRRFRAAYRNRTAGWCVFNGVGKELLCDEREPLFTTRHGALSYSKVSFFRMNHGASLRITPFTTADSSYSRNT